MTIEDYNTATVLLKDIEDLGTGKQDIESGNLELRSQGSILNAFIDVEATAATILAAIDAEILAKQNEFDAL